MGRYNFCAGIGMNLEFVWSPRIRKGLLEYSLYVYLNAESCHEFEEQSEIKFDDKSQKEYILS